MQWPFISSPDLRYMTEANTISIQRDSADVFKKFDGKMLSVDEAPTVLSGSWEDTQSVLIEFPSKESAMAWMTSEDYQAIAKHRDAGSTANAILVNGLDLAQ